MVSEKCGFIYRIRRLRLDGRPKRTRLMRLHQTTGSVWTGLSEKALAYTVLHVERLVFYTCVLSHEHISFTEDELIQILWPRSDSILLRKYECVIMALHFYCVSLVVLVCSRDEFYGYTEIVFHSWPMWFAKTFWYHCWPEYLYLKSLCSYNHLQWYIH